MSLAEHWTLSAVDCLVLFNCGLDLSLFATMYAGYKMCARLYLNGDGMGKGTHVSLFFVVMRGAYDALLKWPFRQKVCVQ